MREGRGIHSRGLSTAKYKGLEMADKGKKIEKVNRMLRRPLQD